MGTRKRPGGGTLSRTAKPFGTRADTTPAPAGPASGGRFHGWRIVAYSALAMAMTAPGQTTGVQVFIAPPITDLGVSRTQVSTAYLTGTLVGARAMPLVGRMIDLPHSRLRSSGGGTPSAHAG